MNTTSSMREVRPSSVVQVSGNQTATEIDGEKIILDLSRGIYYGLNPVGSDIWDHMQSAATIDEIVDAIVNEYDVDRSQCLKDTLRLIQDLQEKELVNVQE